MYRMIGYCFIYSCIVSVYSLCNDFKNRSLMRRLFSIILVCGTHRFARIFFSVHIGAVLPFCEHFSLSHCVSEKNHTCLFKQEYFSLSMLVIERSGVYSQKSAKAKQIFLLVFII